MNLLKSTIVVIAIFLLGESYAQNNVGIGTLTPNPNAVLEIQSADKGLLIPRLTTAQRNIFGTGLANTDNSMLVYDVNDSVFYYWKSTVWIPIPGTSTDNQNIDSVRLNPLDSVLTVYIEDGLSASVDLKSAFDNTDEQTLTIVGDSLEISNGNRVLFIDNDTTNEKIDSVTYLNDTLTVYEGDSVYKTEIIGGEWADADKIGGTGYIYAKQALNNGTADTVVITDDGYLGVGLSNPYTKFQVDGNARIGRIREMAAVEPPGPGNVLYFSGGPDVSTLFDTDNSDWIGMGRFNISSDVSELRIRIGDNQGAINNDAFVLGSALIGFHQWNEYFRVQSNGYVHIGTSALPAYPTNQLHLQGEINPLRVEGIQPGASTDSLLTIDATGVIRKIPNAPSGEWNDADSIGLNGFIYAKQALNNGAADTVVVTDNGSFGVGMSSPIEKLHTKGQVKSEFIGGTRSGILLDPTISDLPKISFRASDNTNRFEFLSKIDPFTQNDRFYLRSIVTGTDPTDTLITFNGGNGNTGIGTTTPTDKLQINGNVRVGLTTEAGVIQPEGWGNLIHFSGGPDVSAGFNSDNSDGIFMGRYNISNDLTELRIRLGDNLTTANNDAFVIGSALSGGTTWQDYFRVQSNGFTGIGINPSTYPTNQLHVIANANPLRLEGLQQGAISDSVLSVSNTGVVRKVEQVFLPPGMVSPFATVNAPAGWLVADGSAVSRTTYANLFAAIGTMYGAGDGSTTFNLPDYRGQFLRGVSGASGNDPDVATRTNRGDGTTGNNVGTKQQGDFASHNHQLKTSTGTPGTDIVLADDPAGNGADWEQTTPNSIPWSGSPAATTFNTGGNETRPKNVYVTYCIKY